MIPILIIKCQYSYGNQYIHIQVQDIIRIFCQINKMFLKSICTRKRRSMLKKKKYIYTYKIKYEHGNKYHINFRDKTWRQKK